MSRQMWPSAFEDCCTYACPRKIDLKVELHYLHLARIQKRENRLLLRFLYQSEVQSPSRILANADYLSQPIYAFSSMCTDEILGSLLTQSLVRRDICVVNVQKTILFDTRETIEGFNEKKTLFENRNVNN